MKIEDAPEQFRERLKTYEQEGVTVLGMSTLSKEGVAHVKNTACDKLLSFRIETKSKDPTMMASINKLNVATPRPRDSKVWFLFFDFFSIKDRISPPHPPPFFFCTGVHVCALALLCSV